MAIIAVERLDKREFGGTQDEPRWSRSFVVYTDPSTETLTKEQALRRSGIPTLNESHPEDASMAATDVPLITQTPGASNSWEIVWKYQPRGGFVLGEPAPRDQIGFLEWVMDIKIKFIDAWRVSTDDSPFDRLPSSAGDRMDIGGESIDSAGRAVSVELVTVEVLLNQVVQTVDPGFVGSFVGSRNTEPFLGLRAGSVLYLGVRIATRLSSGRWRLQHRFVADEFDHARQNVKREENGQPKQDLTDPADPIADTVFWIQPFPRTANFGRPELRKLF